MKIEQEEKVIQDKREEIARLNKLMVKRHRLTDEALAECEALIFEGYFRACTWLNMQMLMGSTKGTGAYATVVERLFFVVRDIAKTTEKAHGKPIPFFIPGVDSPVEDEVVN